MAYINTGKIPRQVSSLHFIHSLYFLYFLFTSLMQHSERLLHFFQLKLSRCTFLSMRRKCHTGTKSFSAHSADCPQFSHGHGNDRCFLIFTVKFRSNASSRNTSSVVFGVTTSLTISAPPSHIWSSSIRITSICVFLPDHDVMPQLSSPFFEFPGSALPHVPPQKIPDRSDPHILTLPQDLQII